MKTVGDVLADSIENWLAQKKTRNLNLLSRNSGVSYATVRRIAMRENGASAEIVAAIAAITMSKSEARKIVQDYFPSLRGIIDFGSSFEKTNHDLLEGYLASSNHFPILMLANAKEGIDEKLVASTLGVKYLPYLRELIDSHCIENLGSRYYLTQELDHSSMDIARSHLRSMLEITSSRNDSIPTASAAFALWNRLSKEGIRRVREKTLKFKEELSEIISDTRFEGDIVWYSGWLSNILLNEEKLK